MDFMIMMRPKELRKLKYAKIFNHQNVNGYNVTITPSCVLQHFIRTYFLLFSLQLVEMHLSQFQLTYGIVE